MTIIQAQVPDPLARQLEEFARAVEDFTELERRAQRASREKFESSMAKVPNIPPASGDEL